MLNFIKEQKQKFNRKLTSLKDVLIEGYRYLFDDPRQIDILAGCRKKGVVLEVIDNPFTYTIKPIINFYRSDKFRSILNKITTVLKDVSSDFKTITIKWPAFLLKKGVYKIMKKFTEADSTLKFYDGAKPELIYYKKLKHLLFSKMIFIRPNSRAQHKRSYVYESRVEVENSAIPKDVKSHDNSFFNNNPYNTNKNDEFYLESQQDIKVCNADLVSKYNSIVEDTDVENEISDFQTELYYLDKELKQVLPKPFDHHSIMVQFEPNAEDTKFGI
jgi:hypothetical protein